MTQTTFLGKTEIKTTGRKMTDKQRRYFIERVEDIKVKGMTHEEKLAKQAKVLRKLKIAGLVTKQQKLQKDLEATTQAISKAVPKNEWNAYHNWENRLNDIINNEDQTREVIKRAKDVIMTCEFIEEAETQLKEVIAQQQ